MITSDMFANALALAARAHQGQVDKAGVPYISHILRVATLVLRRKGGSIELATVAALHDVLEDSCTSEVKLRNTFSESVVEAVLALTRKEGQTYRDYLTQVSKNNLAVFVKRADLQDNLDRSRLTRISSVDEIRLLKYKKALLRLHSVEEA